MGVEHIRRPNDAIVKAYLLGLYAANPHMIKEAGRWDLAAKGGKLLKDVIRGRGRLGRAARAAGRGLTKVRNWWRNTDMSGAPWEWVSNTSKRGQKANKLINRILFGRGYGRALGPRRTPAVPGKVTITPNEVSGMAGTATTPAKVTITPNDVSGVAGTAPAGIGKIRISLDEVAASNPSPQGNLRSLNASNVVPSTAATRVSTGGGRSVGLQTAAGPNAAPGFSTGSTIRAGSPNYKAVADNIESIFRRAQGNNVSSLVGPDGKRLKGFADDLAANVLKGNYEPLKEVLNNIRSGDQFKKILIDVVMQRAWKRLQKASLQHSLGDYSEVVGSNVPASQVADQFRNSLANRLAHRLAVRPKDMGLDNIASKYDNTVKGLREQLLDDPTLLYHAGDRYFKARGSTYGPEGLRRRMDLLESINPNARAGAPKGVTATSAPAAAASSQGQGMWGRFRKAFSGGGNKEFILNRRTLDEFGDAYLQGKLPGMGVDDLRAYEDAMEALSKNYNTPDFDRLIARRILARYGVPSGKYGASTAFAKSFPSKDEAIRYYLKKLEAGADELVRDPKKFEQLYVKYFDEANRGLVAGARQRNVDQAKIMLDRFFGSPYRVPLHNHTSEPYLRVIRSARDALRQQSPYVMRNQFRREIVQKIERVGRDFEKVHNHLISINNSRGRPWFYSDQITAPYVNALRDMMAQIDNLEQNLRF